MSTIEALPAVPENWNRALAVVAHPDDMEYGAASAVARWTAQGKDVRYLLVTRGEAGIDSLTPAESIRARDGEQLQSCAAVGVSDLTYLDHPDGVVVNNIALRRDLAHAIRRDQPDVVIGVNFRDTWGGPSWNHADHRAVGEALLDAVRDAANRWLFPELGAPWGGVHTAIFGGSPRTTHAVDITDSIDQGVASLKCHTVYLNSLGPDAPDPDTMLRSAAAALGERQGVAYAVGFELFSL